MGADEWGKVFEIVWAALALSIGSFAFFFTNKFNEGNARRLEWLYTITGLPLFKHQAAGTRTQSQYFVSKLVGGLFIAVGVLVLLGKINFQA